MIHEFMVKNLEIRDGGGGGAAGGGTTAIRGR